MSSNSQFQLFPPPAPQGVPKNPFRRGPRKPSIDSQSTTSTPLEESRSRATEAKAVVFQVVEPSSIKLPPQAHVPPLPPRSSTPELRQAPLEESLYSSSPQVERRGGIASELNNPSSGPSDQHSEIGLRPVSPPQPSVSPVVPIKSIFPQFNPNAPPTQHQYHGRANSFSRPRRRPEGLKLDITPAPEIDRALGPRTVPADVHDFGMLSPAETQYSSPEQLKALWDAANGQRADNLSKAFNIRMERLDPATFVFGDPSAPFYTMQTYSTNEVSLMRGNPCIPNSNIPIMMLQLEDRRRREAPNDGLVSHLFSRLAAMLAIDQATELSRQHQLSPPDAMEVEANALKRAAALESCKLSWNPAKQVYELRHPSLATQYQNQNQNQNQQPGPSTAQRQSSGGALHISVSKPTTEAHQSRIQNLGVQPQRQAPTIVVTAPRPNNTDAAAAAAFASPRTSTLPLSGSDPDSDETLASLDLRTMTLSISASAINKTIPSLYAIDSVVAAILAVSVSDVATNPALADMAFYDPSKTTQAQAQAQQVLAPPQAAHTANRLKLYATLAEREGHDGNDIDNEIQPDPPTFTLPSRTQQPQVPPPRIYRKWLNPFSLSPLRSKIAYAMHRSRRQNTKSNSNATSPATPGVEEIDLEKYGIGTSATAQTQTKQKQKDELPGVARGIVKLITWGFKLTFWALGVAFKLIGWVISVLFRCVTGKKLE
ncbi:uncharacterized protein BDV17DRAFT_22034 [Aspergillus undulatus]|uniref:uncharacterized protein n=1 Tax=Aspergillus undulatus TaxID=1810928 RepID=UPI003CCE16D7